MRSRPDSLLGTADIWEGNQTQRLRTIGYEIHAYASPNER